jgi:hypothetical protein
MSRAQEIADLLSGVTITTADNNPQLTLESTDADANFGPVLKMHRNSSSPADSDFLGEIQFQGENDAGEAITYAQMFGRTVDVSDSTEDGRIATKIMIAGTAQNVLDIKSDEIVINDDSVDLDFRVESNGNTHGLFLQGSSGFVGIGKSSPVSPLDIEAADGVADNAFALRVQNLEATDDRSYGAYIQAGSTSVDDALHVYEHTGSTSLFRVAGNGNVGIGCTNGDITSDGNASRTYVTIQGTANRGRLNLGCTASNGADTATLGFTNGANTVASISCDSDSGSQTAGNISFATAGSVRAIIDSSGNVLATSGTIGGLGSYNNTTGSAANVHILSSGVLVRSTSSSRYKNTINDATHGLTELLTLRPVTYKGNSDGDTVFGGLIAEEVHDAGLTEFVQYNDDNEPDSLAYANMVSLCIKAIQEQQATITALEARIAALEAD